MTSISSPPLPAATKAEVVAGTATDRLITPQNLAYSRAGMNAWVYFQGTGTVAIQFSQNVSSITDNGTGNYTVNFSVQIDTTDGAKIFLSAASGQDTMINGFAGNGLTCDVRTYTRATSTLVDSAIVMAGRIGANNV